MLTYNLEERGEQPRYEFLYEAIKSDIVSGRMAPNEKLPSKRKLAQHLSVSLITVEGAYRQLIAEGYIRSIERRGFYVNQLTGTVFNTVSKSSNAPAYHQKSNQNALLSRLQPENPEMLSREQSAKNASIKTDPFASSDAIDITGANIAHGIFPYNAWAKSLRKALADASEDKVLGESGAFGSLVLREAIANFLYGFRGIEVDPQNIVIGAGSQVLYQLIIQLIGRDRQFAIENPGYTRLARIYEANDVSVWPLAIDNEGIALDALTRAPISVAHIMPTHQYPTGQITSIARRYELLSWAAQESDRYLIEDDYDCEFRFSGRPIPSLQSIDTQGSVIYLNTFAKSMGPSFRISYMVLPHALSELFHQKLGFYSCTVNALDQLALARFISSGDYERHVNRLRTHFRSICSQLQNSFKSVNDDVVIKLENAFAGSHCLLRIEHCEFEHEFAQIAAGNGVLLQPLSNYWLGSAPFTTTQERLGYKETDGLFVIDYAALSAEDIPLLCERLVKTYNDYRRNMASPKESIR